MIYSGPHMYVSNPLYKNPHKDFGGKADYDVVDLVRIPDDFLSRTNFIPAIDLISYKSLITGFPIPNNNSGTTQFDNWIDHYKVAFRNMLSQSGERTLTGAIIPPNSSHVHTVVSAIFMDNKYVSEFAGITSSIVLDFLIKTVAASNLSVNRLNNIPLCVEDKFSKRIILRTNLLNCINCYYAQLWSDLWDNQFQSDNWSQDDLRLKDFTALSDTWCTYTPLRNHYERRLALVEIDVLVAMALGLSIEDLEMMYTLQFPVLQQNEEDTWYDQKGNIVFTCAKGLFGVGIERKQWESIRGQISENGLTCSGTSETYVHTIDPAKSEMYGGQQVTYYAPYTKCDRIEDYRRAWAHFEKIFNEEKEN